MRENLNISIIVPAYNEEESLPELCDWIHRVMDEQKLTYEVIIIDDGSTDDSWRVINQISGSNSNIKSLKFSRNYGKSAALNAGFKACEGQVVITMDADLQDSPDELPELYRLIQEEGYDLVSGWKKKRYDPITKTLPSKLFNGVTRIISGIKLHDFNCGLKAYHSNVIKNIDVYGEMHRYIPVIAKRNGFGKITEKVVEHRARKYGYTKFGLERFIFGFLDLLSITFVSKFRKRPMHFFGSIGTLSFLMGFFITLWLIGEKLYKIYKQIPVRDVVDQPLFFLALVALICGVQLFLTGFLAELITTQSNTNEYQISKYVRMNDLRIIFMGTPEFAVPSLQALIENKFNVVAIITAPDKPKGRGKKLGISPIKEYAQQFEIPILQPKNLKSPAFLEELASYKANLQVVVAFRMLPEVVWQMPELGTFNLHASLLPNYRGAAPINWAIMNGDSETGVTTFFLQHQIDTGNIIFQESEQISPSDNAGSLYERLMHKGAQLVLKTTQAIAAGNVSQKPQVVADNLSSAPKIFRETCELNWDWPAYKILNRIRGLSPYPGAWTTIQNKICKIYSAQVIDLKADWEGVFCVNQQRLLAKASDKTISILELQLEGKRRMQIQEFLRGNQNFLQIN